MCMFLTGDLTLGRSCRLKLCKGVCAFVCVFLTGDLASGRSCRQGLCKCVCAFVCVCSCMTGDQGSKYSVCVCVCD